MYLFSFLKKKQRTKTRPDTIVDHLAEDALQTSLAGPNVRPQICVASDVWLHHSAQQLTNITLVQGSSDSKPERQSVPEHQESKQTKQTRSIRKDYRVNITLSPEIKSVQHVHRERSHARTLPQVPTHRLYPSLDQSISQPDLARVKENLIEVKEPKLIHDIGREICFQIQPKILYAIRIEKKLDRLKVDAQRTVLTIKNMITSFSKLDYTFNKELDVAKNYSHIKIYQKLYTFDDVRSCHQKVNEPIILNVSNNSEVAPVFQDYYKKLGCYKGQRSDIIDCD